MRHVGFTVLGAFAVVCALAVATMPSAGIGAVVGHPEYVLAGMLTVAAGIGCHRLGEWLNRELFTD